MASPCAEQINLTQRQRARIKHQFLESTNHFMLCILPARHCVFFNLSLQHYNLFAYAFDAGNKDSESIRKSGEADEAWYKSLEHQALNPMNNKNR